MISRVAESCFWMFRYIERLEHTSRLVGKHHELSLNVNSSKLESWEPLLTAIGEQERFYEKYGSEVDREVAQEYLIWDSQNSISAYTSLKWARENARTIREIISMEMWEDINMFWLWFSDKSGRKLYNTDRYGFYQKIRQSCQLFHGIFAISILRDSAYDFMCLGMMLERASQIARILDVNYELFSDNDFSIKDSLLSNAHWVSLLRSSFAKQSYFRKFRDPLNGHNVLKFLLLDLQLPVSVLYSLTTAEKFLNKVYAAANGRVGKESVALLRSLIESIHNIDETKISPFHWHQELTKIVNETINICNTVHIEFFDFDISRIEEYLSHEGDENDNSCSIASQNQL